MIKRSMVSEHGASVTAKARGLERVVSLPNQIGHRWCLSFDRARTMLRFAPAVLLAIDRRPGVTEVSLRFHGAASILSRPLNTSCPQRRRWAEAGPLGAFE